MKVVVGAIASRSQEALRINQQCAGAICARESLGHVCEKDALGMPTAPPPHTYAC